MTLHAPVRISGLRYLTAAIAARLDLPTDHLGADWPNWEQEIRAMRLARPAVSRPTDVPTAVIPPVRRPIAAITAQPHGTVVDQLGAWQPHLHPLQPAVLADTLAASVSTVYDGGA